MPRFPIHRGCIRSAWGAAWHALALVIVLVPPLARGDTTLYQAVVPLEGATEADRAAGFGEALKVAAVRASGRREAASNPSVVAAAADPQRYVQQYSTTPDRMMKVGFDGRAVEQLLQQAGLPIWPAERPVTLVALFLPSVAGGTRAVLASERPPERAEVERVAQARGLPIDWPQVALDAAAARARPATASAVLVGSGADSGIAWTFLHADQSTQGRGGLQSGVDLAADTLAARYAPPSTRSLTTQAVRIAGVEGVGDYAGLLEYLQSLSVVRAVDVVEASGSTVRLNLTLRGDLELLRRIAALDTHLKPAARGTAGEGAGADFAWQP